MNKKTNQNQLTREEKDKAELSEIAVLKQELALLKTEHALLKEKFDIWNELAEEGLFFHENLIIKEANNAFEKLTGYTQEELVGMHGSKMLTPESIELLKNRISESNHDPVEVTMIAKDGSIIYAHTKGKFVKVGNKPQRAGLVKNITEIRKAQKSLEESEEKHRLVSSLLSDYVYTCTLLPNKPPVIGMVSGAMENISGYSADEIDKMSHGWYSVIHPDDVQRIADSVNVNYAENKFYNNEYRIIDKEGKIRWLKDRSMLIKHDESTKEVTLLGATKDISDKKKIEEDLLKRNLDYEKLNKNLNIINEKLSEANSQLGQSERKYKNLIESFGQGIGISFGEKILYANTALLKIYGFESLEAFVSKKLTDYMTAESKAAVIDRLNKYVKKIPQDIVFRYDIIRADGEIRTLEIMTKEIRYEGRECRQAIINDITSQLETEDAVSRAAHIFENIQIGLFIYKLEKLDDDRSLRLIAANPASSNLININDKEMIGKTIDENFPNLRMYKIPQQYAEVVRNQIPIAMDDIYYEDERIAKASFSVKVFPLPNQCVGVSFENVSERRKAEQELRTRNHELNNFVYKVSHDLRAPLSSIKGLIHLSKLEKNQTNHLPKIEERANHLDGFIRDILSHSRNLNTAVVIEKLDLEQIISDCFVELKYLSDFESVAQTVSITGEQFYSDKIRFYEITRNMISNAIKYQDYHKKDRFLHVTARVTPKFATITFKDNGIGILEDFQESIFNMFFRATELSEGSGIGLYIVKQAIEKLGGKVHVKSTPDEGSLFTVKLPNLISKKEN